MPIFPREKYLDALVRRMWNGSVKVITGVRRCGKSYLLNELFTQYLTEHGVDKEHIISISLDTFSNRAYRDPAELDRKIRSLITDGGKYYLILDEIQFVEHFEELLNEYVREKNIDTYVSGSNSHLLSKDIITEFRGRGDEVRIHPLSFSEYYSTVGGDRKKALMYYMTYGGMPKTLSITDDNDRKKYLSDLFNEVYIKDIVERNGLRDDHNIGAVVDVLSSSIGSLTNPKKIADTLRTETSSKITRDSVVSYIEHLTDSFLFEESKRFDICGRRYIGAQYKFYAEDVGLRNARLNFRQQEYTYILENVIYNELRSRGYNVDVGIVRKRITEDGVTETVDTEIDFVVNMGERRYYIQTAYSAIESKKREQEVAPFSDVRDSFKKILLVGDEIPLNIDDNGIITMNVYDFLLDERSLEKC